MEELIPQLITDDEIYDIMVRDLPQKVRLTAVVDACHSGTVFDLPYEYNEKGEEIKQNPPMLNSILGIVGSGYKPKINQEKRNPFKDVICFSSCKDEQTSGNFNGDTKASFFSAFFTVYLDLGPSYRQLLQKTQADIFDIKMKLASYTGDCKSRDVRVSSSYPIDMDTRLMI